MEKYKSCSSHHQPGEVSHDTTLSLASTAAQVACASFPLVQGDRSSVQLRLKGPCQPGGARDFPS